MNHPRNRVTRLAVLSLMLIGAAVLIALSGWPKSAQAINLLRSRLSHPIPDQLMRSADPNATSFPIATGVPNASAFVTMQTGCRCADIVLVIDNTSSMKNAIANVDAGMTTNIIPAAQAAAPGPGALRMGLVTVGGVTMDTATVRQPLTTNVALVSAAVSAITVEPGGLQPEASDEALRLVVNGSSACGTGSIGTFRPECFKIIVLATDAQTGGCCGLY